MRSSRIRHALIMAAGRGARMMPLTRTKPKPMAEYGGSTLISSGIRQIGNHVDHVHITVGYQGAMLARHVISLDVSTVIKTDGKPNSWWIYNSLLSHLNEPVYVLTCDNVVELDFERLEENYFALSQPACMIVPVKPVPGLDGDYIFHDNQHVTSLSRDQKSDIYCSGIQVLNPRRVAQLTEEKGDFYTVWNQLIQARQLMLASVYPDKWFTVDTVEQLRQLNDLQQIEQQG